MKPGECSHPVAFTAYSTVLLQEWIAGVQGPFASAGTDSGGLVVLTQRFANAFQCWRQRAPGFHFHLNHWWCSFSSFVSLVD